MVRRGFTLVELMIVIIVMGVLLVLGVANLRGTQAQGRDSQRMGDAQVIANNLEQFYNNGGGPVSTAVGRYPSTLLASDSSSTAIATIQSYLSNIDVKVLLDPSATTGTYSSLVPATNTTQTTAGVTPQPSASNLVFVYQPLASDGSLCTAETTSCRKFNLYYWQETTSTILVITSRNQ